MGGTEFEACVGVEVSTSRGPFKYNGMKIVKSHSCPLDDAYMLKSADNAILWVGVAWEWYNNGVSSDDLFLAYLAKGTD